MHGLLCETRERSLSLAEFSDRAPLTKLYPSLKNLPPHVRESKTVLDSGLRAVDSGFQVLDSGLFQWTLDSGFRIPDSTSKNLSDSAIRILLHGVKSFTVTLHPLFKSESVELKAKCRAVVELG